MESLNKVISSFKLNSTLQPKIWIDGGSKINPNVRKNLLEIAYQFIDSFGMDVVIDDIIVTGSIANYNWSEYSDVDLHILVDYKQFSNKLKDMYVEYFDLKKIVFNQKRDIKMFGYEVEVFVEDTDVKGVSGGLYSVLNDEWIKKPTKESVKISKEEIIKGAKKWMSIIDTLIKNSDDDDIEGIQSSVKNLKNKLKKFRLSGLKEGGELGLQNLIFKVLRRNGYIEKLYSIPLQKIDKKLSIKEITLSSPLENLEVAAKFGVVRPGLDTTRPHSGTDFRASTGTPIYAPADGTIVKADMGENGGCGGSIFIEHSDGLESRFCHSSKIMVNVGDIVKRGEVVGLVGGGQGDPGRGFSTGSHLHYTLVKNGELVDPIDYIDKDFDIPNIEAEEYEATELNISLDKISEIKEKIYDYDSSLEDNDDPEILEDSKQSKFMSDFLKMVKSDIDVSEDDKIITNNPEVEQIQIALQFLEYLDLNYGIDGFYDEKTINALNEFRDDFDLPKTSEINKDDLLYMYYLLLYKLFDDTKLSRINKTINFDELKITNINNFYQMVLITIGADITYNNVNFLNAWNDATSIGGEENPFGLPYKKEKNISSPLYNTIDILNTVEYSCVRFGLTKNKKIDEILSCPIFRTNDLKEKIKNFLHK
jgi:hypothetical protein